MLIIFFFNLIERLKYEISEILACFVSVFITLKKNFFFMYSNRARLIKKPTLLPAFDTNCKN